MKQFTSFVILLLFFATNSYAAEHLPGCPSTSHSPEQCAALIEEEILNKHGDLFQRKKEALSIKLRNGKKKTYITTLSDNPETFVIYILVNYYDTVNFALILVQYYEGITYQLLNTATGVSLDVHGYALLSPEKTRFLVYHKDIDAEYSPNTLRIYRIKPRSLALEFDALPEKWGPSDVLWVNEKKAQFNKNTVDMTAGYHERQEQKYLKYLNGKWIIE